MSRARLQPSRRAPPGVEKKQTVPAELLEEAFELNMLLEEAKMGGVDERPARATGRDAARD